VDPDLTARFAGPAEPQDGATAPDTAAVADLAYGMNDDHRFGAPLARPAGADVFALLARTPQQRALPRCRHVPARAGGRPA
jgi:hypothetical protein